MPWSRQRRSPSSACTPCVPLQTRRLWRCYRRGSRWVATNRDAHAPLSAAASYSATVRASGELHCRPVLEGGRVVWRTNTSLSSSPVGNVTLTVTDDGNVVLSLSDGGRSAQQPPRVAELRPSDRHVPPRDEHQAGPARRGRQVDAFVVVTERR
jgi:hypothetical protein